MKDKVLATNLSLVATHSGSMSIEDQEGLDIILERINNDPDMASVLQLKLVKTDDTKILDEKKIFLGNPKHHKLAKALEEINVHGTTDTQDTKKD